MELGGGGGLGWLRPYRPSPPNPVFQASTLFPHLSLPLPPPPLCIIYCQEKGTETRKEGSRKGGAVHHPLTHSQNPGGMGVGQGFGPKPQPLRNPHSRSGTPRIRDRLLLQFPSSSWGRGPHFTVCVYIYAQCVCVAHTHIYIHTHTYIYLMYNSLGDHPNLESLCPKTSAWNWNEGSGVGGEGLTLMPTKLRIPDPGPSCPMCSPLLGMAPQALVLFQPGHSSLF